jgi:hypothetical protein
MKQILKLIALAGLSLPANAQNPMPAYQIMDNDTTCEVFIYSPGPRDGLHLAYLTDDEKWRDAGQLCSSDYSTWGSEKRMYNPFVLRANDGTWRLLFGVNDYSPCFAAAYSEDLVVWRPQDYPRMNEKGVFEPVMFQMDDGTFDIYFKTKDGQRRYVQATQDFRHFTESPDPSTIDDVAWMRDTATVAGKRMEGNQFEIPKMHLDYIFQHFAALKNDAEMSAEKMADDAKRFASIGREVKATLTVNGSDKKAISDKIVGVFFEDISQAADGGLYAELVQNRDFEYTSNDHKGWGPTTAWRSSKPLKIETEVPLSKNNPHYVVLNRDTLYNIGWDGITDRGGLYDFSFYVRNIDNPKNQFDVALVASDGTVLAEERVKTEGQGWNRYTLTLNTDSKKRSGKLSGCQLRIVARKEGRVAVDMISLFPRDTYKGHGLRKDLAEAIAALKPKFMRFPGGCMSHGQGLDNIYHWSESVGPWQDRKPAKNIWNYHQTRGLGFYEYFQFCEDIGAEPLPVLAAGVPCQNSAPDKNGYGGQQGGIPMKDMPTYCEEILHLIEWANGDPNTSKWAKMRADAGHPAPFHLKYIGIGNEDIISTAFEERYEMICKAIRKKYPEIKICGTVGPFHYPSADYIEGWKFANEHKEILDLVDEHYYESPGWFMHHQDYYDQYDRKGVKVYLGEYASHGRTVENALVEAMHLCSLERNGDVVEMSSYAPLLCREKRANWNPDMIYFDSDTITSLTPSYHTQYLFGNNSGDQYIASKWSISDKLRYRVAASVVKDSKTGRTYLKLVNALPANLSVKIEGIQIPNGARTSGFSGQPSDKKVSLVQGSVEGNVISLKPYSVQVVEL